MRRINNAIPPCLQGETMKSTRKLCSFALAQLAFLTLGASAALAADKPLDVGKGEYDAACAVCHGLQGKGDGPMTSQLTVRVPDVTVLAKNNGGVFPFDRVYQVIDGRKEVKAHGTHDMPVWGAAFNRQTSIFFQNYPAHDPESAARSRILALTEYLYRLQGK
jgi:mono/diheme cytochrome c family protein